MKLSSERNYLAEIVTGFVVVPLIMRFFPNVIPFGFFDLWHVNGNLTIWAGYTWPILAWGFLLATCISVFTKNTWEKNKNAEKNLLRGYGISAFAGITEEIGFRWIIFMATIISVKLTNFLFFGWLGFGIWEWFQIHFFGPVGNFLTLGLLSEQLVNPTNWVIGAAILSANAFFRDGHKYQGTLGYVNSWFCGMFFFSVALRFGLPIAIAVHFLYDGIIFTVHYFDCVVERITERAQRRQFDY